MCPHRERAKADTLNPIWQFSRDLSLPSSLIDSYPQSTYFFPSHGGDDDFDTRTFHFLVFFLPGFSISVNTDPSATPNTRPRSRNWPRYRVALGLWGLVLRPLLHFMSGREIASSRDEKRQFPPWQMTPPLLSLAPKLCTTAGDVEASEVLLLDKLGSGSFVSLPPRPRNRFRVSWRRRQQHMLDLLVFDKYFRSLSLSE